MLRRKRRSVSQSCTALMRHAFALWPPRHRTGQNRIRSATHAFGKAFLPCLDTPAPSVYACRSFHTVWHPRPVLHPYLLAIVAVPTWGDTGRRSSLWRGLGHTVRAVFWAPAVVRDRRDGAAGLAQGICGLLCVRRAILYPLATSRPSPPPVILHMARAACRSSCLPFTPSWRRFSTFGTGPRGRYRPSRSAAWRSSRSGTIPSLMSKAVSRSSRSEQQRNFRIFR